MQKILKAALFFSGLVGSQVEAYNCWYADYPLTLLLDYCYLNRFQDNHFSHTLTRGEGDVLSSSEEIHSKDLNGHFNPSSTAIGSFRFRGKKGYALEGIYMYVWPWETKKSITGSANLQLPFEQEGFAQDFIGADKASGLYRSFLQNAELNACIFISPERFDYFSFAWILGFRFIALFEKFNIEFTRNFAGFFLPSIPGVVLPSLPSFNNGPSSSNYRIKTQNLLYGAQGGGLFEINPSNSWTWLFGLKGAAFLNAAQNSVFLGDNNNTVTLRDFVKKRWISSFLLEAVGRLSLHVTKSFDVHVGYDASLLTGLLLAPDQVDLEVSNRHYTYDDGQIVVHGVVGGIDFNF